MVADSDVEYYEYIFRVNLMSVVLGCKHATPRLLEQGGGAIINTSSGAALQSRPQGGTAYAASKAAVESVTRSVAVQYGKQGIRCNGIAPDDPPRACPATISPEMLEVMEWSNQAPRLANAEQQAAVVVFLASDDASYSTGHTLPARLRRASMTSRRPTRLCATRMRSGSSATSASVRTSRPTPSGAERHGNA